MAKENYNILVVCTGNICRSPMAEGMLKKYLPGYFWIFPLENGYANVGVGMLHKTIKNQKVDLKKSSVNYFLQRPVK